MGLVYEVGEALLLETGGESRPETFGRRLRTSFTNSSPESEDLRGTPQRGFGPGGKPLPVLTARQRLVQAAVGEHCYVALAPAASAGLSGHALNTDWLWLPAQGCSYPGTYRDVRMQPEIRLVVEAIWRRRDRCRSRGSAGR